MKQGDLLSAFLNVDDEEEDFEEMMNSPNLTQAQRDQLPLMQMLRQNALDDKKEKEDFKKIYTLKDEDYDRLTDYITLPLNPPLAINRQKKSYEYDHIDKVIVQEFSFNPNTVSYEDLIRLGISPRAAKGLIK